MRRIVFSIVFVAVILLGHITMRGQDLASVLPVTERLEKLRVQLREVKAQESALQERLRLLNIDLQPENLQRAINSIGTLSADELREQRRRQLESEKATIQEKLTSLTESRLNLEKTIAEAEIEIARLKAAAATAAQESSAAAVTTSAASTTNTVVAAPVANTGSKRSAPAKRKKARRSVPRQVPSG